MRIALCQTDIAWLDVAANLAKIEAAVLEADRQGAEMAVFPEMALTGFSMEPEKAAVALEGPEVRRLVDFTKGKNPLVVVGAAIRGQGSGERATNRCLLIRDGKLLGDYAKVNLFSFSKEPEHYGDGRKLVTFEYRGFRFCPLICYDLRFSELFLEAAEDVSAAFLVIANWPSARADHWKTLLKARALDTQAFVIGVNRVGFGGSLEYSGDSGAFSPTGVTLAGPLAGEGVTCVDLDFAQVARFRGEFPVLKDRRKMICQPRDREVIAIPG